MADDAAIDLSMSDLRAVAAYAASCAQLTLPIFEQAYPEDPRPRTAVDAGQAFAEGAPRTKSLRDAAWAAMRAANEAGNASQLAAREAARAAVAAASAAYLHPLAKATQVKHILGAAAHGAHAVELAGGDAAAHLARAGALASPGMIAVLARYPPAPPGGARAGELMRQLDSMLRGRTKIVG